MQENSNTTDAVDTRRRRQPGPYTVTALLCLGWVFMYADRTVLSPITGVIGTEWGLSKAELGLMSTVFFIAYALMQLPAGIFADRFGRVRTIVIGYALFAIGTFLSGIAPGFMVFLLVRAFAGFGEGTYYGPAYGIASSTIDRRFRGLSAAIINSGMALGISLGFIGSSVLAFDLNLGWQTVFFVFGVATLVVTGLIQYFLGPIDRRAKSVPTGGATGNVGWRGLFTTNHVLAYVLIFCSLYGFFNMLTWLPLYLQQVREVPAAQTGIIASLVPWASVPGAILFGLLSDRMKSKKPLILVLCLLGAACQIIIPWAEQYSLVITALVIYGLVGKLALDPILISYLGGITPRAMYSRSYSMFNFAGMLSSILAPYITGYLADVTGKLEVGFYISAALLLVGAVVFLFARPTAAVDEAEQEVTEEHRLKETV
ncbi:MFS transporter [Streptomyces sp. NPDC000880]